MDPSIAQACQLYDPNSQLFLAFSDTYNYGLLPTRMPSIIYRELLSNKKGQSLADLRKACLPAEACGDGDFIRGVIGNTYPQIDVWSCDTTTGVASVLA